jgi:hypothetical protein
VRAGRGGGCRGRWRKSVDGKREAKEKKIHAPHAVRVPEGDAHLARPVLNERGDDGAGRGRRGWGWEVLLWHEWCLCVGAQEGGVE